MNDPKDYLKRLEAMNGGPLRHADRRVVAEDLRRGVRKSADRQRDQRATVDSARPAAPIRYQRDLPRSQGNAAPRSAQSGRPVTLEDAVPGEVVTAQHGQAYQVVTAVRELSAEWHPVREIFASACADPLSGLRQRLAARCALSGFAPEDVVFFDLETTGLASSPLFLIGVLLWEDDDLVVRQYLARHYGEEAAVTALFLDLVADKRLLVSFNGKSFDLPYVRTRAAANGIRCRVELPHLDLLHEARRIWRGGLPNCQLQTLEQHVCGRPPRYGDIPGNEIPEAYHAYVRTGNASRIVRILQHNLLDLVTLADLSGRLPGLEG